jgi:hypothetical protein
VRNREPSPRLYLNGKRSVPTASNRCRSARTTRITVVSCCVANPGMVSWMVKQALLDSASDPRSGSPSRNRSVKGRALRRSLPSIAWWQSPFDLGQCRRL